MTKLTRRYQPLYGSFLTAIDIETTGLDPNTSGILNVSLVTLLPKSWGKDISDLTDEDIAFLPIATDPNKFKRISQIGTLNWHNQLPEHVKELNFNIKRYSWEEALDYIDRFFNDLHSGAEKAEISHYLMGNGPDFDQAFLKSYYQEMNREEPWEHWQNIDFRTLASVQPVPKEVRYEIKKKSTQLMKELLLSYEIKWGENIDLEKDYSHFSLYDAILELLSAIWIVKQLRGK